MNRIFKTTASVSLSTSSYVTPTVSVIDVKIEGVLCASGQLDGWEEGELDW